MRALTLLLCGILAAGSLANAGAAEQRAVLTIRVNTVPKQDATVTLHDDDVLVQRSDLEEAGLQGFAFNGHGKPDELISLASLKPALAFRVDDVSLSLDITVTPQHLSATVLNYGPHQDVALSTPAKSAFFNYSLSTSNQTGAAFAGEFGTRLGSGAFSSTFSASGNRQYNSNVTNWVADSPQSDRRLTIGDVVTATGDLGGTVAIAGAGYQRYFGLNPNIVKTALPQITGNALTPSTADIYVNGVLYRHEILPPGQFSFQNLPIGQGPNNTSIVVTDAFGRQQTYTNFFYGSDMLLAKGMSDFSYAAGVLHSQFGEQVAHGAAAAARYSAGLSDNVTGGGRFEASGATVSGGPAFTFRFPSGIVGVEGAVSRSGAQGGSAALISFQHMDARMNAAISATVESPGYSSLALVPSQDRPLRNLQVSLSRQFSNRASMSLSYYRQDDRDNGMQDVWQLSHMLTVSETMQVQVSETLTSGRGQKTLGVQTAINFIPHRGLAAAVNAAESGGREQATLQLQRSLEAQTPSFGYTLSATAGNTDLSGYAAADYRGAYGNYTATFGTGSGQTSETVNLAGGLAFIGGRIMPTQSINDGYALIDTGVPHVHVLSNNVVVGSTNAHGYLLVSQLGSYMNNDITLASSDLPLNYRIDEPTQTIAPGYRSGAIVRFGIAQVRPITGKLRVYIASEMLVPAYGILSLDSGASAQQSDIGEDGEFYFDKLSAGIHHALVQFHGGACTFDLTIPQSTQPFVKLGTVVCHNGVHS